MSQQQLPDILSLLQSSSDNAISLSAVEWEALFKQVTDHFIQSNNARKDVDTGALLLKILDMLTFQFLEAYTEASTRPWSDTRAAKARLELYILDSIAMFASHTDAETFNKSHSTKSVIARILSYLLANAQFREQPQTQASNSNDAQAAELTPALMRDHALNALAAVVKALASTVFSTQYLDDQADTVRSLLRRCLVTISEMTDLLSNLTLPAYVTFVNLSPPVVTENASFDLFSIADELSRICIKDTFQLSTTLHDLIRMLTQGLDGVAHWSLEIFYRETITSISRIVNALLSGAFEELGQDGIAILNACVTSMHTLAKHHMCVRYRKAICSTTMHILHFRLKNGPKSAWEDLDTSLLELLDGREVQPVSIQMVSGILDVLVKEDWGPEGEQLRQCSYSAFMGVADTMGTETAHQYFDALSQKPRSSRLVQLLSALDQRRNSSSTETAKKMTLNHASSANLSSRKDAIILTVLPVVSDDGKERLNSLLDDDAEFELWSARAVPLIEETLLDSIRGGLIGYTEIASVLSSLPCLFNHSVMVQCKGTNRSSNPPLLNTVVKCFDALNETTDKVSQDSVHRQSLDVMAKCIRHQASKLEDDSLVMRILVDMKHEKRTVRLAAGRILIEALELYQCVSHSTGKDRSDMIFGKFDELLSVGSDPVKETTVVILGLVGKLQSMRLVERCVFMLIMQLGQANILVRSTAFTQITSISRHHGRTTYSLALPHLGRILQFTLSSVNRHPSMLNEICRLLITNAENLIPPTLPEILPKLFAECDETALGRLEKILKRTSSNIFSDYIAEVFVGVFLLEGEEASRNSLQFLKDYISTRTDNIFDVMDVLKNYLWKVLADLVVEMGHEDPQRASVAKSGIEKVQRLLKQDEGCERPDPENTSSIFVDNLLGIVTHLNDEVQDIRQSYSLRNRVLRGLGLMISEVKSHIVSVAPQIMATLQTSIRLENLSEATLTTWNTFVGSLNINDLGPVVGQTSASIVDAWPLLTSRGRQTGKQILEYIVLKRGEELGDQLDAVNDLSNIRELLTCADRLRVLRKGETAKTMLCQLMRRMHTDNVTVISQSLEELRAFMADTNEAFIRDLTSGDVFDPVIGTLVKSLLTVACRGGEERARPRSLAFECIGILGAIDPDRFDIPQHESSIVVMNDFADESESLQFAMHLIQEILIRAYRSTSDTKYQSEVAFALQELLKVCGFTIDLVVPGGVPVPLKVRARWNKLSKHVLDTVTPLLASKYALPDESEYIAEQHPIYDYNNTYREWIQHWASHLISKASGNMARRIFRVFKAVVRNNDVGVTQQILPHLALNVLMSGSDEEVTNMRTEITAVLEDQLDARQDVNLEKKRSSAQMIFTLMDHFNKWLYFARLEIAIRRQEAGASASSRRSRQPQTTLDLQVLRVDSILASIDQNLLAQAAFECDSYARSLMNYEKHIQMKRSAGVPSTKLQDCYERLHEIYAHLDEPDGMEGVSTCIVIPSLEHHIRQHESTGRWTSAQSCWEIRLQQSPDNLDYHIGLLRCLRNLGHYDSLRTHIQGVLVRNPDWAGPLSSFQVEGALMANDWATVLDVVSESRSKNSEVALARVFLAMRSSDETAISSALTAARSQMGEPITTAGERGYRRAYDAILSLHILKDIETIHKSSLLKEGTQIAMTKLRNVLDSRFEATLPSFRTREPILNMHRAAFSLGASSLSPLKRDIGQSWLSSAKIARKAGQWQTAYSAVLQARECNAPLSFIQSAKLVKATGEPLRALSELDVALQSLVSEQSVDLTLTQPEAQLRDRMLAKAKLLRARWMRESERYDSGVVLKEFTELAKANPNMESAYFHAGHFQDELYNSLSRPDKKSRGQYMVIFTVKQYARSLRFGSKYTYQTVPRVLTLWLDMGEDPTLSSTDTFAQVNKEIDSAIRHTPIYKWLTAFPQVVSRVDHRNNQAYAILSKLILTVMQEHPQQSLWLFMSCVKSTKSRRERRGSNILDQLKSHPQNTSTNVPSLVQQAFSMATELLRLCDAPIKDNDTKTLSMARDFPLLKKQAPSDLIIPLQESLTVNLPTTSSQSSDHQPFPPDAPKFYQFLDEVDIMKSLARPRKITIVGTNSEHYIFLGKPKDDLRKDARLMDFNAIINKLLRSNSDSRRRRLRIRTYSVVTLNEECGFIQWVPNTMPIRPVLMKYYSGKGIDSWKREWAVTFQRIKEASDKDAAKIFREEILKLFPGVFHQWFLDQFPEPTAWLSSRLAYSRTMAVMSMVGFILGLGDRHLENILLDVNTGDVVHVDFNCLFERGKTLDTPERVPFRLTQNLVDGLGVTGVEGVFRTASEITMQLLRANKDVLMNVLDAFIHDPLVEWEDEKRKRERQARNNSAREAIDPRRFAKEAVERIRQKLQGMYVKDNSPNERRDKEIATSNLVQLLIEEATDLKNLAKMYPGWAPWH